MNFSECLCSVSYYFVLVQTLQLTFPDLRYLTLMSGNKVMQLQKQEWKGDVDELCKYEDA